MANLPGTRYQLPILNHLSLDDHSIHKFWTIYSNHCCVPVANINQPKAFIQRLHLPRVKFHPVGTFTALGRVHRSGAVASAKAANNSWSCETSQRQAPTGQPSPKKSGWGWRTYQQVLFFLSSLRFGPHPKCRKMFRKQKFDAKR